MAMAKPIIITDVPANRSIVGDSECGIYTPSANPEDIANAILYSHTMKHELKGWGTAGRAIVEEKYDWKRVAECLNQYLTNR
jgi:glycosyltransferase involved in cell wall biosynthesis